MDAGSTIPGRCRFLLLSGGVWQRLGENRAVLILLLVLLLFSAYFSASETSLTAANRVRMKARADSGDKRAGSVVRLTERFENTLTTILVGNNIVNIAIGSISTLLAMRIGVSETVMTVIVTVVVILFGEVFPKTAAKRSADSLSRTLAPTLRAVTRVLTPVSAVFIAVSRLITRLFAVRGEPSVSEDDIYDMIENMEDNETVDSGECRLLYSAFEFSDVTVGEIFTERADMVWIDATRPQSEIVRIVNDNKFSRLPVCAGDPDHVTGVLRVRPYLEQVLDGKKPVLSALMSKPYFVAADCRAGKLLEQMQKRKVHLAIVRGEENRTLGMITLEDLIEELVGEIWDESDDAAEQFRRVSENVFEMSARLSVPAAFELMGCDNFDREECGHRTLEKWLVRLAGSEQLRKGSVLRYRSLQMEVLSMRYGRIRQLRVTLLPEESEVTEQ